MPVQYRFLLLLAVLLQFGIGISVYQYFRGPDPTFVAMKKLEAQTLQLAIDRNLEELNGDKWFARKERKGFLYSRRKVLGAEQIERYVDNAAQIIEDAQGKPEGDEVATLLVTDIDRVTQQSVGSLLKNADEVKMRGDDVHEYSEMFRELDRSATQRIQQLSGSKHSRCYQQIIYLEFIQNIVDAILQTHLYSSCWEDYESYFPVVNTDRVVYALGDTARFQLGVGSFTNQLRNNATFYVNGKEIALGEDGRAEFSHPITEPRNTTLKTRVEVRNPVTGEVRTGEGSYTYHVLK